MWRNWYWRCRDIPLTLLGLGGRVPHITSTEIAGRSSGKSERTFREARAGRMVFVIARIRSAEAAADSANGPQSATPSFAADQPML